MSVAQAGVVASLAVSPASFRKEVTSACTTSGDGLFSRGASCSALLRRKTQHSSTMKSFNVPTRLYITAKQNETSTIKSVPVQVAHELLNAGHRCLDVRTTEEFTAGHVKGAVNIPYLIKTGHGMSKNPKFLAEVEKGFSKDDEILIGCQSGRRSLMAAAELRDAKFTGVIDMGGGYLAWKENGLPVNIPNQA